MTNGSSRLAVEKPSPSEISELLRLVAGPVSGSHLLKTARAKGKDFEELLSLMLDRELLVPDAATGNPAKGKTKKKGDSKAPLCKHLVVVLSGAVMSANMQANVVSLLVSGFCEKIDVILTASALKFVVRSQYEALGIRTWIDPFDFSSYSSTPHITLAQSASLVLCMPASAHLIQRLAAGACSDLASLVITATAAPVVVVPAMNETMWSHPAVRRNVAQLVDDGLFVVEPGLGRETATFMTEGRKGHKSYGGVGIPTGLVDIKSALTEVLSLHRVLKDRAT